MLSNDFSPASGFRWRPVDEIHTIARTTFFANVAPGAQLFEKYSLREDFILTDAGREVSAQNNLLFEQARNLEMLSWTSCVAISENDCPWLYEW